MSDLTELDFSLTPTALLRKNIRQRAFNSAQKTKAATWFARGELNKEEYIRLLMLLWHIYDEMQRSFAQHDLRMMIQAFSACAAALARDISYLLGTPQGSWQAHPKHAAFTSSPPQALSAYLSRLQVLTNSDQPALLLVHAFVRHLGDARGGLILHDRLEGVYGPGGQGISFLDFQASKAEFAQLVRWYEDQLDFIVGDDREMKGLVVQEGIRAFELNCGLFAALDESGSTPSPSKPVEPSLPALGNPVSESEADDLVDSWALAPDRPKTRTVGGISMASFVAVAVAICISQGVIIFGGLTAARVSEKLQAVVQWSRSVWESFVGPLS